MLDNRNTGIPGRTVHAKTGTAQFDGDMDSHAWYAGFLPYDDYPLAFVVIVEHAGSGRTVATPIANAILREAIGN